MNEPTLDALIHRLDRLERRLHWWKILGSVGIAIVSVLVLLGATGLRVSEEIRARRFTLVGKSGEVRAALAEGADFVTGIAASDIEALRQGKAVKRATFGRFAGVGLVLYDRSGRSRATLTVQEDSGAPRLRLYEQDGTATRDSVELSADADGPTLWLQGPDATSSLVVSVDPNGIPELYLGATGRRGNATLAMTESGEPYLSLRTATNTPGAVLGQTSLETRHAPNGEQRAEFSFILFDSAGKVAWKAR